MTYLRKNLIVLSVVFMMLLTVFGGSLNINALENNSVTDTDYPQYVTGKINSVSTDPAIGKYFSGVISLKIDVHYQNAGEELTATQYFRL